MYRGHYFYCHHFFSLTKSRTYNENSVRAIFVCFR
jgi:hypothetical protein